MGDCTTQTGRLATAKTAEEATCQNGRNRAKSAKMAVTANLVPNALPIWQQQILCQKIFFFDYFFFLQMPIPNVESKHHHRRVEDEQVRNGSSWFRF
jgi:hypothetical protein